MIRTLTTAAAMLFPTLLLPTTAAAGPFDIPVEEQETSIDVGAALLHRDAYVGSDETDTNIYPYLAGEYKGRVFLNPAQGAGVNLVNDGKLQVAALASFAGGRDAEDTPFVSGDDAIDQNGGLPLTDALDDAFEVDSSITAGGLVSYLLPFARADLQVMTPVTGDIEGVRADASLTTRIPIGPFFLAPGVRATWLSDAWTETYYGIDNAQATVLANAGNTSLINGLDVDDSWTLGAHAIVFWEAVDDVNVIGALNYSALQGDAKDSPLSPSNDGLTAIFGVAKRF